MPSKRIRHSGTHGIGRSWGIALALVAVTVAGCSHGNTAESPTSLNPTSAAPSGSTASTGPASPTPATTPSGAYQVLPGSAAVTDIHAVGDNIYAFMSHQIVAYGSDGAQGHNQPISWPTVNTFAVDSSGDYYVARLPNRLVKITSTGATIWSRTVSGAITAVFPHQAPSGFEVGAVTGGHTTFFDAGGRMIGSAAVAGNNFTDTASGGLVTTNGSYVDTYDSSLKRTFYFGAAGNANNPPPGQFAFYQQGSAIQLGDGDYLVADATRGIELVSPRGVVLGIAPESVTGSLTQDAAMVLVGDRLYYAEGPRYGGVQQIAYQPVGDVISEAMHAGGAPLGFGVGLTVPPVAYVQPGAAADVRLGFNRWWAQLSGVRVSYSVQSGLAVQAGARPTVHSVMLTPATVRAGLPVEAGHQRPGPYQVAVTITEPDSPARVDTLQYGVGARGDDLHLASMPGTFTGGGPDGARGVALAHALGTGAHRVAMTWSNLLTPSGQLTFAYYDPIIAGAYRESQATGTPFSVQICDGGAALPFISNGTWQAKVEQIVRHFKSEVNYWEPYNEPNNSFSGSAADYVNQILKPTYEAVKAVEPNAKVIGGTVLGYDLDYWQGIANAGGLHYMDIAGIHPYPAFNHSFEEQGFPAYIASLRQLFQQNGVPNLPIWITELAWWSGGAADIYDQANYSARAMLWMRALDIPRWEYFTEQGDISAGGGEDYSAIEDGSLVKPAALALMAAKTQLAGRTSDGFTSIGIPHSYDLRLSAAKPGGDTIDALWTDDFDVRAAVIAKQTTPVTVVDEYGAARHLTLRPGQAAPIRLSGSVQYLQIPAGSSVTVESAESFGDDVAAASNGGQASASSTNSASEASGAIDGDVTTDEGPGFPSGPAWVSAPGDPRPTLTVQLPHAETLDRVIMVTTGIGSVMTSPRDYQIQLESPGGAWTSVASVHDNFYPRMTMSRFPAQPATAIRLIVQSVNYSGVNADGSKPSFWQNNSTDPNSIWYGPAIVRELEAFAPGARINVSRSGGTE